MGTHPAEKKSRVCQPFAQVMALAGVLCQPDDLIFFCLNPVAVHLWLVRTCQKWVVGLNKPTPLIGQRFSNTNRPCNCVC